MYVSLLNCYKKIIQKLYYHNTIMITETTLYNYVMSYGTLTAIAVNEPVVSRKYLPIYFFR